ncbi:peptidoglycan D,D-transpeptidase FtsI family protein [Alicyclobacillus herbarius]|uniref:peptidoglycan D,D-transpeptidase FtsI family protein n=1 Tax=Alicyclobacillus herbarius TaxID=122960 RepID=UPI00041E724D|nr:penicillin-binding transpeptidase domain-containing protein [Alicyclobacillus herbarius]
MSRKMRLWMKSGRQTRKRRHPPEDSMGPEQQERPHGFRVNFVYGVIFVAMASLVLRLGYVQINEGQSFRQQAATAALNRVPVLPPRGWIYDSNGNLLAYDQPTYSVTLTRFGNGQQDFDQMAQLLAPAFHMKWQKLAHMMKYQNEQYQDITLFKKIDDSQLAFIQEHQTQLPGISIQTNGQRTYPYGDLAGQVLGYTGQIPKTALKAYLSGQYNGIKYKMTQYVGLTGLEKQYEKLLQGQVGEQIVSVNKKDKSQKEVGFDPEPVPGKYLQLTLDGHLQAMAQEAVLNEVKHSKYANDINMASAVVLDVKTGGVLAMVSYPYFDPNWYTPGNGGYAKHSHYLKNTLAQMNTAIASPQPPGSTVKPANLITGLEAGVISAATGWADVPYLDVANKIIKDDASHGWVNPIKAIAESCDVFFYRVGLALSGWVGSTMSSPGHPAGGESLTRWQETDFWKGYIRLLEGEWRFGLGQLTGIDLPGEVAGRAWIDNFETGYPQYINLNKIANQFKQNGKVNLLAAPPDLAWAAIGQMQQFTPIELAQYVATIADGGKRLQPHLLQAVYNPTMQQHLSKNTKPIETVKPKVQANLHLNPQFLKLAQEGMRGTCNTPGGTAYTVFKDAPYVAAGKTGTAEITLQNKRMDNSVFIGYAPYNNPQIAVVVMVPGAGYGADTAAPVARQIMDTYFQEHHQFFPKKDWQSTSIPANWKQSPAYQEPEQAK